MLYLGIYQHPRQTTISLRDDQGDVILTRHVSTRPEKIHALFQQSSRSQMSPIYRHHLIHFRVFGVIPRMHFPISRNCHRSDSPDGEREIPQPTQVAFTNGT